jgi:hypothetical protein
MVEAPFRIPARMATVEEIYRKRTLTAFEAEQHPPSFEESVLATTGKLRSRYEARTEHRSKVFNTELIGERRY